MNTAPCKDCQKQLYVEDGALLHVVSGREDCGSGRTAPQIAAASIPPRQIADIAEKAARLFERHGWRWATGPGLLYVPGSGDIALAIRRELDTIQPGERVESGRLLLEWPTDEETGEPEEIRVFVHLGDLPLTTPKDPS